MACVDIDVLDYIDELRDSDLIDECERRGLYMPIGVTVEDLREVFALMQRGRQDDARRIMGALVARAGQRPVDRSNEYSNVQSGKHPFLRPGRGAH